MLAATATALTQSTASFSDANRPESLSIVQTPRQTRPVEQTESGGGAKTGDQSSDPLGLVDRNGELTQPKESELPERAPNDTSQRRLGPNFNMVFDEESGRPIIEIINPRTGEVTDRIPPENLLERAQKDKLPTRANFVDETA